MLNLNHRLLKTEKSPKTHHFYLLSFSSMRYSLLGFDLVKNHTCLDDVWMTSTKHYTHYQGFRQIGQVE